MFLDDKKEIPRENVKSIYMTMVGTQNYHWIVSIHIPLILKHHGATPYCLSIFLIFIFCLSIFNNPLIRWKVPQKGLYILYINNLLC